MNALVSSAGGHVTRTYSIIAGVAALVPQNRLEMLRSSADVVSVDRDIQTHVLDQFADNQIGATSVWPLGYTGTGVRLAILDTGIMQSHPEFTGRIIGCHSEQGYAPTCEDDNGHGTHVAGIAGASGANPGAKGVAPLVLLLVDKTQDSNGFGNLSTMIAGINWAVSNQARIISMSIGDVLSLNGQTNCDWWRPSLTAAVNNAVAAGVTVVAASGDYGNLGPDYIDYPACISSAIAVGAVNNQDQLWSLSEYGAAMQDHGIVAPGIDIFSAWISSGNYGTCRDGGGTWGHYAFCDGTSMATPMVSGTIALMLNRNPSLTPAVIKSMLYSTATCTPSPSPTCPNIYIGHGRVNAYQAVTADTRLTNTAAASQTPAIAVDSSGSYHIVWTEGGNQIYYTKLDANRNTLVVNTLLRSSNSVASPSIAVNSAGVVTVVWSDRITGSWGLYYRQYSGGVWGAVNPQEDGIGDAKEPDVTVDPNGNFPFVWRTFCNNPVLGCTGEEERILYGMVGWGSYEEVYFYRGTYYSQAHSDRLSFPHLAVVVYGGGGTQKVSVVWERGPANPVDGSGTAYAYYKVRTGNTPSWSALATLGSESGVPAPRRISVASDSSGHVYAAWEYYGTGAFNIAFRRSNDAGATWQAQQNIVSWAANQIMPTIALGASGKVVVGYSDYSANQYEVYSVTSTNYGQTWPSSGHRLTVGAGDSLYPKIAIRQSTGLAGFAWQDYRDANWEIYFSTWSV